MQRLMKWSMSHPAIIIVLLISACIFAFPYAKGLKLDASAESMMVPGNLEMEYYKDTLKKFGSDSIVIIFVQDKYLFSPAVLLKLRKLFLDLGKVDGVDRAESLFTVSNFRGSEGMLENNPLMDYVPETQDQADKVKANALNSPILKNNLISEDGTSTAINLYLECISDPDFFPELAVKIEAILEQYAGEFETLVQIGTPYTRKSLTDMLATNQKTCIPLSFLTILIMLMLTTRSVSGAVLPILTSSSSVLLTLGFMGLVNIPINILTSIIPLLIIVIGSTEDVHLMSEYMEGLHQEKGIKEKAVHYMASKVGTAVLLTALTTCIGFISISINEITMLRQFGIAAGFGLFINPLVTATLAPVYLRFFGPEKSKKISARKSLFTKILDFFTDKIIYIVQYKKKITLILMSILVVVVGSFSFKIRVDNDTLAFFKEDSELVQRMKLLHNTLSGGQTFFLRVDSFIPGAFKTAQGIEQLDKIQAYFKKKGWFDKTISFADYIRLIHKEMNNGDAAFDAIPGYEKQEIQEKMPGKKKKAVAINDLTLDEIDFDIMEIEDDSSQNLAQKTKANTNALISQYLLFLHREEIESYVTADYNHANILVRHNVSSTYELAKIIKEIQTDLPDIINVDMKIGITGEVVLVSEAADSISSSQIKGILLLLVVIFIIMSFLFVNIKAGFLSLIPNIFPIALIFGIMGLFNIPLDTGTCMVAVIAIGVAVDDTIHFMSRYNKEARESGDENIAIATCIRSELRPVLATSLSLSLGFAILMTSELIPIRNFGFLAALAMGFALLGDLLITPILLSSTRLITLWDMVTLKVKKDLMDSALFKGLKTNQIKKLLLTGQIQEARKGDYIIRKGESGESMFVLLNGNVKVFALLENGEEYVLSKIGRGSLVGELALLSGEPRAANVIADDDVTFFEMNWAGLQRISRIYPRITSQLYYNLAGILGQRFIATSDKLNEKANQE
jgi:uncharacterized protein